MRKQIAIALFIIMCALVPVVGAQTERETDWLGRPINGPVWDIESLQVLNTPSAAQGPIFFNEPEIPPLGFVDGFSTNTLNGNPLPGTLSFATSIPNDARFSSGPPAQDYLDGFGIEGAEGQTLTINFGVNVSDIQFSFALCETTLTSIPNGVTVQGYNEFNALVGSTTGDAFRDVDDLFPEGIVTWSPPAAIRYIQLTFANVSCNRFLLDELLYYDVLSASCSFTVATNDTLTTGNNIVFGTGSEAITMNFNSLGTPPISSVTVICYPENHPNATVPLQTGYWWDITYLPHDAGTVTAFDANLTFPAINFTPDINDKICRYTGSWDCAYSSHAGNMITRNNVNLFSNWTLGNNATPTSISLQGFQAVRKDIANHAIVISFIGLIFGSLWFLVKRHR